jgi:hypothetical protein
VLDEANAEHFEALEEALDLPAIHLASGERLGDLFVGGVAATLGVLEQAVKVELGGLLGRRILRGSLFRGALAGRSPV